MYLWQILGTQQKVAINVVVIIYFTNKFKAIRKAKQLDQNVHTGYFNFPYLWNNVNMKM